MRLLLIVLVPFVGAALPALSGRRGAATAWVAALMPAICIALLVPLVPAIFAGHSYRVAWDWLPALGLLLSLRLDGLSLLFLSLILGIGLLVIMYARYYLSADEAFGKFYAFLLLFMGSMIGVVLSDNLLVLLIFWELTSLCSFLLIGFWHDSAESRQGARMALTVTGGGALALLAGVLLLAHIAGSYEISEIVNAGPRIREDPFYAPTLILILIGAFAKSAQFPLHFWLPQAMAAPTPVSAYLHSATMVKAGVFLIARLYPALSGTDLWFFIVGGVGAVTLLYGAYTALFQHDIKGLLAYSTISHLGLITLLFGMGGKISAIAAVFHIINHSIFKASLFMAAGIIDHETGTRDMRRINGLWNYMPHTATLAMVSAASMAGVPLFNGFLSKEMFFAETLDYFLPGGWSWLLPTVAVLAGIFAVAYSIRFIHDVFFNGEPVDLPRMPPHEPPRYMKIPVEVLVGLCLLVGVFPGITVLPVLSVATAAVLQTGVMPDIDLKVWHGFTGAFAMSMGALLFGALLYASRRWVYAWHNRLPPLDARSVFAAAIDRLVGAARSVTGFLENGSQQRYLLVLFVSAIVLGASPFVAGVPPRAPVSQPLDETALFSFVILSVAAIGAAVWHRQRVVALILIGVVGLIVVFTFAHFSAPDLALTQLLVEVVSIILLLLALFFLPREGPRDSSAARLVRDAVVAGVAGIGIGWLSWLVASRPHDSISQYYIAHALTDAGGANVVNVILVDFRGFDTLGEITVLVIAAIGIYTALHRLTLPIAHTDEDGRPWALDIHPLILATVSRPLLPLALLVSLYLFLRGHQLPGGGFIAGLVASVALILQYLASGITWTRARITGNYYPIMAAGIATSALTGLGSWIFGRPFLTSAVLHVEVPVLGDLEIATALFFDLGVFLTVIGTVMLILERIGEIHSAAGPAAPVTS